MSQLSVSLSHKSLQFELSQFGVSQSSTLSEFESSHNRLKVTWVLWLLQTLSLQHTSLILSHQPPPVSFTEVHKWPLPTKSSHFRGLTSYTSAHNTLRAAVFTYFTKKEAINKYNLLYNRLEWSIHSNFLWSYVRRVPLSVWISPPSFLPRCCPSLLLFYSVSPLVSRFLCPPLTNTAFSFLESRSYLIPVLARSLSLSLIPHANWPVGQAPPPPPPPSPWPWDPDTALGLRGGERGGGGKRVREQKAPPPSLTPSIRSSMHKAL